MFTHYLIEYRKNVVINEMCVRTVRKKSRLFYFYFLFILFQVLLRGVGVPVEQYGKLFVELRRVRDDYYYVEKTIPICYRFWNGTRKIGTEGTLWAVNFTGMVSFRGHARWRMKKSV